MNGQSNGQFAVAFGVKAFRQRELFDLLTGKAIGRRHEDAECRRQPGRGRLLKTPNQLRRGVVTRDDLQSTFTCVLDQLRIAHLVAGARKPIRRSHGCSPSR
jgi:hypothetical protein